MTQQLALVEPVALVPWTGPVRRGQPLFAVRLLLPPHAKERPHSAGRVHYTPKPYREWLARAVAGLNDYALPAQRTPIAVPVVVRVDLVFPRPKKGTVKVRGAGPIHVPDVDHRTLAPGRLDLDNGVGAVLDALVQAAVLADDGLYVQDGGSAKWWAAVGEETCVEVRIYGA